MHIHTIIIVHNGDTGGASNTSLSSRWRQYLKSDKEVFVVLHNTVIYDHNVKTAL